jgi:hypothetical protein
MICTLGQTCAIGAIFIAFTSLRRQPPAGSAVAKVKYHLLVLCEADLIEHVEDSESAATERYIAAASAGA